MSALQTKTTWFILLMVCCGKAVAQPGEIAVAEQAFAQMAVDSGIQKAFCYFLDSNSLIFRNGKSVDALPFWKTVSGNRSLLLWKPVYTGMAHSGDLGFSTGPFEHRQSPADAVEESGNYSSVWVKNNNGQWKVLIDMSVPYQPSTFQKQWDPAVCTSLAPVAALPNWQPVERDFIDQYRQQGAPAFHQYITNDSWFNIQDQLPLHTIKDIDAGLQQIPAGLQFSLMGGGMATTGDLFYAYGTVTRNGREENYLQVWGHQKDGWKLLLQVLKWPR